jgi:hypothetical protein
MRRSGGRPAFRSTVLHLDGAANGIYHATKFYENTIPCPLDDVAIVHGDGGIDQIAPQPAQSRQGPILVGTGELAVPDNICRQNCGQLSGLRHGSTSREGSLDDIELSRNS